jgi:hypothetical protein
VSLRVLSIAAVACLAPRAWGERAVRVVARGAPFDADQLAAALRVRLAPEGAPLAIEVTAATADRVTVAIGDATREVELGGRTGPAAARLVALAIVDLALDDLTVAPGTTPRSRSLALALLGSATSWTGVLAGPTAELVVAGEGGLAALELAGAAHVGGTLHVTGATVRLCGGVRFAQLELRAGVAIAPVWVSDGMGDQTTLVGATTSARLRFAVRNDLRLVVALGLDAYTTQTTYQLGEATITTPWLAPWVAAGMELSP